MCETGRNICKLLLAAAVAAAIALVWLNRPRRPKYIDLYTGDTDGAY